MATIMETVTGIARRSPVVDGEAGTPIRRRGLGIQLWIGADGLREALEHQHGMSVPSTPAEIDKDCMFTHS